MHVRFRNRMINAIFSSSFQKRFPKLGSLNVSMNPWNQSAAIVVTLDSLQLSESHWKLTGVNTTITSCSFSTSTVSISQSPSSFVEASTIGAIVFKQSQEVLLRRCHVNNNPPRLKATAIEFHQTDATLVSSTFAGVSLKSPLVLIDSFSEISMQTCNFTNNKVVNGTIKVDNGSSLTLDQSYFSNNNASDSGSCILLLRYSLLLIYRSHFLNNTAKNNGGVILSQYFTRIEISRGTVFDGNTVTAHNSSGGAISNYNGVRMVIVNTTFMNHYSDFRGGVINAQFNCTILLDRTDFLSNKALDSSGAIQCYHQCLLNAQACTFKGNIANDGGGIESINGTLLFDNCTFENNTSLVTDTGALTAVSESVVKVWNCIFHRNRAGRYGPAMQFYNQVHVHINGSNFTENMALVGAGVLYAESNIWLQVTGCYFARNSAAAGSATLSGNSHTYLNVTDSYFINNTALTHGGGAIAGFTKAFVDRCHFIQNKAGVDGGAISGPDELHVSESTFVDNFANLTGGAISCAGCTVTSTNCNYTGNHVRRTGGAIQVSDGSELTVENNVFSDNKAAFGNGGAIYLRAKSTLTAHGGAFIGNSALYGGGAVESYNPDQNVSFITLRDVLFAENSILFMGGGLYVGPWVKLTATNCSFVNNFAQAYGGAVKVDQSSESCFQECLFLNNTAVRKGGAIYVKQQQKGRTIPTTTVKVANSNMVKNTADVASAIFVFSNTDSGIPPPKLDTLNTAISGESFALNTSDPDFEKNATELNVVISEPDPKLNHQETPFASGDFFFLPHVFRENFSSDESDWHPADETFEERLCTVLFPFISAVCFSIYR